MKVAIGIIRILFMLFLTAAGAYAVPGNRLYGASVSFGIALVIVLLEYGYVRCLATVFPSVILGMLVGLVAALVLVKTAYMLAEVVGRLPFSERDAFALTACVCCYLAVTCILRTKDDIRVVIPYVEFSRQLKGPRPLLLDTSIIIDGRIADICETGIVDSPVLIPKFVLQELQDISDSADRMKRNRGRRGMDMLHRLQRSEDVEITIHDAPVEGVEGVDAKLVALAKTMGGRIVTTDFNLNKIAQLHDVPVLNVNDLANALKPMVLPGEVMELKLIKPGEEPGQAVGYLDDGTMVVVDEARERIGHDVEIAVTSVIQTSAGRMVFGKLEGIS